MRQDLSPDSEGLATIGHVFRTLQPWTLQLGAGFIVGTRSGLVLGYLLHRSGLVLPGMAVLDPSVAGGSALIGGTSE
jgi:hypothetical protein